MLLNNSEKNPPPAKTLLCYLNFSALGIIRESCITILIENQHYYYFSAK